MTTRTTYWQRSFPTNYDISLDLSEARAFGAHNLPDDDDPAVLNGSKASHCFVSIHRVGTKRNVQSALRSKMKRFMARDKEKWITGACTFVAYVWESSVQRRPLAGFATIYIGLRKNNKAQIEHVHCELSLIYIAAARRGRGLGQMLAAAIADWLSQCRVYGRHVAKGGVSVRYDADYIDVGGHTCGDIISNRLSSLFACQSDGPEIKGWHIRKFDDETN